ncbi:hypothetical protein QE152_g31027 [Popillia japonica]|uniref:Uncharacterized protein n=1 Tax=Popillia japonica TaxID=7064 RepID=A0AAW1JCL7_POPJA
MRQPSRQSLATAPRRNPKESVKIDACSMEKSSDWKVIITSSGEKEEAVLVQEPGSGESQATQQSTIFGVTNPSPKWDEDQKNKKNGQLKTGLLLQDKVYQEG